MIQRLKMSESRSRSSIPTIAYTAVALALCLDIGVVQQVQALNYTVGAGYVAGAIWTNTVDGLVQPVLLENSYKQWAASVKINVGDTLIFNYERGAHTVFILKTLDDYNNCVSTGAVHVTDGTPTAYTVKLTDVPVLYFTCTIPGHCEGGQKLTINLANATYPSGLTPAAPSTNAGKQLGFSAGVMFTLLAASSYLILLAQLSA